ncbi:MAG: nucleoside deaminase [Planctomycetes bacterium]|nr:nucleoside deaminase [Planctomycetota bacterium]
MSAMASTSSDERWIARCLELAAAAGARGEVPVGAVVVLDGVEIGAGSNRVEELRSPLAHAEIEALQVALATAGVKRLPEAELFCSLEPCFLCAGAILHVRCRRVVFAARDPKFGAVRSLANLLEDPRLNHRCEIVEGIAAVTSAELLRAFFRSRR